MEKTTMIKIRKAEDSDLKGIKDVFRVCFGAMAENMGALSPIRDRYYVAESNGKIVAVTGISDGEHNPFDNAYEVTWTGTLPEFRGRGLIVAMLKENLKNLPSNSIPVYCSCWHIKFNKYANIAPVLSKIGFKEIQRNRESRICGIYKQCNDCCLNEKGCYCCEDLWMLDRTSVS